MIDQYQVSTDKRRGITNDPNRADDPQYIVRLIGQSITVGRLEDRADAAGMRISET
jgi:predicted helicase